MLLSLSKGTDYLLSIRLLQNHCSGYFDFFVILIKSETKQLAFSWVCLSNQNFLMQTSCFLQLQRVVSVNVNESEYSQLLIIIFFIIANNSFILEVQHISLATDTNLSSFVLSMSYILWYDYSFLLQFGVHFHFTSLCIIIKWPQSSLSSRKSSSVKLSWSSCQSHHQHHFNVSCQIYQVLLLLNPSSFLLYITQTFKIPCCSRYYIWL